MSGWAGWEGNPAPAFDGPSRNRPEDLLVHSEEQAQPTRFFFCGARAGDARCSLVITPPPSHPGPCHPRLPPHLPSHFRFGPHRNLVDDVCSVYVLLASICVRACVCLLLPRACFFQFVVSLPPARPGSADQLALPLAYSGPADGGAGRVWLGAFFCTLHFTTRSTRRAPSAPSAPYLSRVSNRSAFGPPICLPLLPRACPCSLVPPPLVALGWPVADHGVTLRWHSIRPGLPLPCPCGTE